MAGVAEPSNTPTFAPVEIRARHPFAFRADEWALIVGVNWANGPSLSSARACYIVRFPDATLDSWPVEDKAARYEFRDA